MVVRILEKGMMDGGVAACPFSLMKHLCNDVV